MAVYLYIYLGVLAVSAVSLTGIFFLAFSPNFLKKITLLLVSLSTGALLGDSFLHLLPEAVAERPNSGLSLWFSLLIGIVFFFILEKIVHWRHCHIPTGTEHPHHLGPMNLIGDAFHNFFDGLIIAGSFLASVPLGVTTLLAVLAHEVPQEISDFGILLYAGYTRRRALLANFLTALVAFLGATVAIFLGAKIAGFTDLIIPFTAGGFIYIATADLIPELKKETAPHKSLYQLLSIVFGILVMWLLKVFFI